MRLKYIFILFALLIFGACRKDESISQPDNQTGNGDTTSIYARLYVLNEGSMNENRCTLDYFDFNTGNYFSNIYPTINPDATLKLGDVGNDLQIYGDKMYAVVNMSNKIEVMDAKTAKRIGQIDIKSCRYITFDKGFAYVSSYARTIAGSISGDSDEARGLVAKIDTASLKIVDTVIVGRQPDGIGVANGKLYVANSGGYNSLEYERTVSVIDLANFSFVKNIDVAINLNHIAVDDHNHVFVNSRGDYYNIQPKLFKIDATTDKVTDSFSYQVQNFTISGDSLYMYGTDYSQTTASTFYLKMNTINDGVTNNLITDGSQTNITIPYGILVNPNSKDIYLTDAKDYQSRGTVNCYSNAGILKWQYSAGQIPGHLALLKK